MSETYKHDPREETFEQYKERVRFKPIEPLKLDGVDMRCYWPGLKIVYITNPPRKESYTFGVVRMAFAEDDTKVIKAVRKLLARNKRFNLEIELRPFPYKLRNSLVERGREIDDAMKEVAADMGFSLEDPIIDKEDLLNAVDNPNHGQKSLPGFLL